MVSPEIIRRYPYFSGISIEKINLLADLAEEVEVGRDHYFHHEGDDIRVVYLIIEGDVSLITPLPKQSAEVVINTLGTGDVFGWTSLISPYTAGAGAKSVTPCKLIKFDAAQLREEFEEDYKFGYTMMSKIAQMARERLDAIVIETLAYQAGK
jgi:CRP-like cAMP-binding protein